MILGVDPGSRRTGFGIIAVERDRFLPVEFGVIVLDERASLAERLAELHIRLGELLGRHEIGSVAVEKIFFGRNADSAFKLGHARGVCILAAALHRIELAEYAARLVKQCVVGSGAASKEQVQALVLRLLRLPDKALALDASDALALAITHARQREGAKTLARLKMRELET